MRCEEEVRIPQVRQAGGRALVAGLLVVLVACGRGGAGEGPTADLAAAPPEPTVTESASASPEPTVAAESSAPPEPDEVPESGARGSVEEAPDELVDAAAGGAAGNPVPPPDPGAYALPEEIDVAYAQRVVDALDRTIGEAARVAARERTLDAGFFDRMRAVYATDELRSAAIPGWIDQANRDFPDLVAEPGDPRTAVLAVERADPGCLVLDAERDYNAFYPEPAEPRAVRMALVPAPQEADRALNPTPWVIADEDAEPEEDPCV